MSDSQRTLLRADPVRDSVLPGSMLWSQVSVVAETGSTNEDLIAAAQAGAPEGTVLVAERQLSGRGRLGRKWISEPGAALTFSVLLRPTGVPATMRGWLPLLAGVAVAAGIRAQTGLDVGLKWPNDVLAVSQGTAGRMGKLAGILAEQAGDAIVIGAGLNVASSPDLAGGGAAGGRGAAGDLAGSGPAGGGGAGGDLAGGGAAGGGSSAMAPASLASMGAVGADRTALLAAILRELEHWYLRWARGPVPGDAMSCGLRAEYLRASCTVGRDVRVELPGGAVLAGRACDVDSVGRLLIAGADWVEPVSAGDVIHVR